MKLLTCLMLLACGAAVPCLANSHEDNWPVREKETIQKTLTLTGAPMRVIVDNVFGYVHVTGTNGSEVRMTAHKSIRAESDSDLQEAKKEISLDVTERPSTVSVYYNAPWRCNGSHEGCHSDYRRFYEVVFDIDIEVPRSARLVISTVNGGDIHIQKTEGDFEIKDVNGGINMTDVAGSGEVDTVNGPVTVRFARNPAGPTSFKSVNGELNVYFQPGFAANLKFKTMNGEVYTDFDVTQRAGMAVQPEHKDGKFIYRSNGFRTGQAGNGGPELSFDTLNGNIRIHDATKGT